MCSQQRRRSASVLRAGRSTESGSPGSGEASWCQLSPPCKLASRNWASRRKSGQGDEPRRIVVSTLTYLSNQASHRTIQRIELPAYRSPEATWNRRCDEGAELSLDSNGEILERRVRQSRVATASERPQRPASNWQHSGNSDKRLAPASTPVQNGAKTNRLTPIRKNRPAPYPIFAATFAARPSILLA